MKNLVLGMSLFISQFAYGHIDLDEAVHIYRDMAEDISSKDLVAKKTVRDHRMYIPTRLERRSQ